MEDREKLVAINDSRLLKLLKNCYNISPLQMLKDGDASFIINTESQSFMLHKCSHRNKSFLRSIYLQAYLKEKGFQYASDIIRSTSGGNYIKYGHSFYYLENRIEGTCTPIDSMQDYKRACQVIGDFHSYAEGFAYKDYPLRKH